MNLTKNKNKTITWEEYLEIEDIRDDVLVLTKNRFRKFVEIHPIPLSHCSERELRNLYNGWRDFLNSLEAPIALYIQSRQVDLEEILKDERANREQWVKKYQAQGSVTEEFMKHMEIYNQQILDQSHLPVRRCFMIFHTDYVYQTFETFEMAQDYLNDRIQNALQRLRYIIRDFQVLKSEDIHDIIFAWINKPQSKYISGKDLYQKGFDSLFVKGVHPFVSSMD